MLGFPSANHGASSSSSSSYIVSIALVQPSPTSARHVSHGDIAQALPSTAPTTASTGGIDLQVQPDESIDADVSPKQPRLSTASSAPPTVTPIDQIDPEVRGLIESAIADIYSITTPRDFQIEAINHCAFDDNAILYISAKPADGKSLCPLTIVAMRRGFSIILVPIIGKTINRHSRIESQTAESINIQIKSTKIQTNNRIHLRICLRIRLRIHP